MEAAPVTALACREMEYEPLPLWGSVAIPALAGWLGWGIRGQMGHETGAMVPGGMIGLSLALTASDPELRRRSGLLGAAGAWGISFGGTETYGQTLGLTMHEDIRDRTYWWGLLGCAIKGGAWFGLGGTYLGMAAGEVDYGPVELLALTAAQYGLFCLGQEVFNRPHDPPGALPAIYFSDKYHLDDPRHRPRPEYWGGQWAALLGLLAYAAAKGDRTALLMGTFGILGGAVGFSGGQAMQAGLRKAQLPPAFYRHVDAWKVMETSFGMIGGGFLGLGMRLARRGRPLQPRRPASWWQKLLALGAGAYVVGSHVMQKPWTEEAMDRMAVGGTALAAAFACDRVAWLEALPLVNHYMAQNTVEYYREEVRAPEVASAVDMALLLVTRGLAGLALVLEQAEKEAGRAVPAAALAAMAWGHTGITNFKMLANRYTLGLDDEERRPLPALRLAQQIIHRSAERNRGQLVTESAFVAAAMLLTGLAIWVLGKRR